ncbi:hypothetical protein FOL47_010519 [Perkinsus chesapeaki]|uniref:Mei2-like C-terminal RNA recognition motif domain-containing protein n=1 Tax=Perkinsus chesapeaki TaxID=330153 RepID=A0A7J6MQ70_PERCH|nr:hypothetical protein FOL47_010519 [Perkinsus chesapeaki]
MSHSYEACEVTLQTIPSNPTEAHTSSQLCILFYETEVCLAHIAALLQPLLGEIYCIDAGVSSTGGTVKIGMYDLRLIYDLQDHIFKRCTDTGLQVKAVRMAQDSSSHLRAVVPPEWVLKEYAGETDSDTRALLRAFSEHYGDVRSISRMVWPGDFETDDPKGIGSPLSALVRHRSEGSLTSSLRTFSHLDRYVIEFYDIRSAIRMRQALNQLDAVPSATAVLPNQQQPYSFSWAMQLYSQHGFRVVEPRDLEAVGNFGYRRRSPSCDEGRQSLEIDLQKVKLGIDNRTSVMVRNVPRNYTQPMLFTELLEAVGNAGYNLSMMDYIYMPYDMRQKESSTYVFINVKDAEMIETLYGVFEGRWWSQRSVKDQRPARISYAKCHGIQAILNSLSRGAAQQLPACYRPLVAIGHPILENPEAGSGSVWDDPAQDGWLLATPDGLSVAHHQTSHDGLMHKQTCRKMLRSSSTKQALLPTPFVLREGQGARHPPQLVQSLGDPRSGASSISDSDNTVTEQPPPPVRNWSPEEMNAANCGSRSQQLLVGECGDRLSPRRKGDHEEQCLSTATEMANHCLEDD